MRRDRDALLKIVSGEVTDERVIEAFAKVAREDYVPKGFEPEAYRDRPVPLPRSQTTSQPSLIARMIEAAVAGRTDTVLEVGTGYGFQTALLAQLAGEVISVERHAELADAARANLATARITNVEVVVGDGWDGWPERAPYDAIVVSASADGSPTALVEQLDEGGRLVVPLKRGRTDVVVVLTKHGREIEERVLTPARFVPLVRGPVDA